MTVVIARAAIQPTPPVIAATALTQTSARIDLIAPSLEPIFGVGSYLLSRRLSGQSFSPLTLIPASGFPYVDSTLTANTSYDYVLQGLDQSPQFDRSIFSNIATITTPPNVNPPPPPGKVRFHPGSHGLTETIILGVPAFSTLQGEIDTVLGPVGGVAQTWMLGFNARAQVASMDEGPHTFTSSVGGATSGTVTAAMHLGNGSYFVGFNIGSGGLGNRTFRTVTVNGTSCIWVGALPSGSITTADFYMFNVLQQSVNYIQSTYPGKVYTVTIDNSRFTAGTRGSGNSIVPAYIASNSIYGHSPIANDYGWWGDNRNGIKNANGVTVGVGYGLAVYRPAIAVRMALLYDALGNCFNSQITFDGVKESETAQVVLWATEATTPGVDGPNSGSDNTYSDAAFSAAMKSYLGAAVAAFPNANVWCQNSFMQTSPGTQDFEQVMIQNRIGCSAPDSSGQSYYERGHRLDDWGLASYGGQTVSGSAVYPDSRGKAACGIDIQGPDTDIRSGDTLHNTVPDIQLGHRLTTFASYVWQCVISENNTNLKWGTDYSTTVAIASVSWASGLVTLNTSSNVTLNSAVRASVAFGTQSITVSGCSPAGYNGSFTATIVDGNTITYPLAANPGAATSLGTLGLLYIGFSKAHRTIPLLNLAYPSNYP
jgi:hypothetical protein